MCVPAEEGVLGRLAGKRLIAQGAEGQVFEVEEFLPGGVTVDGDPSTSLRASAGVGCIVKRRFRKGYRHPDLDRRLTGARLRGEVRGLARARKLGVDTPTLFWCDEATGSLFMERVVGETVRETIDAHGGGGGQRLAPLAARIGAVVARLHDGGLVHGDLTTSNMMVRAAPGSRAAAADEGERGRGQDGQGTGGGDEGVAEPPRLVVLDFGLSYLSTDVEDFAVDLYVLERAIASTHPREDGFFDAVLDAYRSHCSRSRAIIARLADVRLRGRKRAMVG